jgi:hypothetical protein
MRKEGEDREDGRLVGVTTEPGEVGKDQVFIYNDKYIIELFFPKKRKNEKYHYMGIGRYGKNSQICIVIQNNQQKNLHIEKLLVFLRNY